jgi:Malectin domain
MEYRFDGLPAGVYEIDLRFAELATRPPNTRLFDVVAETPCCCSPMTWRQRSAASPLTGTPSAVRSLTGS